jgi:hypothetical protein
MATLSVFTVRVTTPIHDKTSEKHTLRSLTEAVIRAEHEECLNGPVKLSINGSDKYQWLELKCQQCGLERSICFYGKYECNGVAFPRFFLDESTTISTFPVWDREECSVVLKKGGFK